MSLGENIALHRRGREMTQEALGAAVGVSMQAVSKWENGGLPDATLLPAIARTLGVSIDQLFGQEAASADVELAIAREIAELPREERMRRAFELCWAIERGIGGATELEEGDRMQRYFKGSSGLFSQMLADSGVTLMKLEWANHYFFISPEPEDGWSKCLVNPEKHVKLFQLLAQRDVYGVLMFVYGRDQNPFTARLIEKQLAIPAERGREILKSLSEYKLVQLKRLDLDDETIEVFSAWASPSLIGLLTFANEMCDRPGSYAYNSIWREKPYLRGDGA